MLNPCVAIKKLSLMELRMRWEEYKRLPTFERQALLTYMVIAALSVGILTMFIVLGFSQNSPHFEPLDKLGLLIELTR